MANETAQTPHRNYTIKHRRIVAENDTMRYTEFTLPVCGSVFGNRDVK